MTEMRVECYSGYRAEERPLRFVFHGHEYEVQDLDGQWYSPDATYFRVRAQGWELLRLTPRYWTGFVDARRLSRRSARPLFIPALTEQRRQITPSLQLR